MTVNDIKKLLVGFAKQTTQVHVGAEPPKNDSTNIWIDTSTEQAWDADAPANVYSTEETIVGRWVDGKPIYRKVYVVKSAILSSGIAKVIDDDVIGNVEDIVYCDGIASYTDGYTRSLSSNELNILVKKENKTISVNNIAGVGFKIESIILEYTKTTDTAQ